MTVAVVLLDKSVIHAKPENVRLIQQHDALREACFCTHPEQGGSWVRWRHATTAYRAFLRKVRDEPVPAACRTCGEPLPDRRCRYCTNCRIARGSIFISPEHRWERSA